MRARAVVFIAQPDVTYQILTTRIYLHSWHYWQLLKLEFLL